MASNPLLSHLLLYLRQMSKVIGLLRKKTGNSIKTDLPVMIPFVFLPAKMSDYP